MCEQNRSSSDFTIWNMNFKSTLILFHLFSAHLPSTIPGGTLKLFADPTPTDQLHIRPDTHLPVIKVPHRACSHLRDTNIPDVSFFIKKMFHRFPLFFISAFDVCVCVCVRAPWDFVYNFNFVQVVRIFFISQSENELCKAPGFIGLLPTRTHKRKRITEFDLISTGMFVKMD